MTPCLPSINGIVPWDGAGEYPTLQVIYLQGGKLPERSVQGPSAAEGGDGASRGPGGRVAEGSDEACRGGASLNGAPGVGVGGFLARAKGLGE